MDKETFDKLAEALESKNLSSIEKILAKRTTNRSHC